MLARNQMQNWRRHRAPGGAPRLLPNRNPHRTAHLPVLQRPVSRPPLPRPLVWRIGLLCSMPLLQGRPPIFAVMMPAMFPRMAWNATHVLRGCGRKSSRRQCRRGLCGRVSKFLLSARRRQGCSPMPACCRLAGSRLGVCWPGRRIRRAGISERRRSIAILVQTGLPMMGCTRSSQCRGCTRSRGMAVMRRIGVRPSPSCCF